MPLKGLFNSSLIIKFLNNSSTDDFKNDTTLKNEKY